MKTGMHGILAAACLMLVVALPAVAEETHLGQDGLRFNGFALQAGAMGSYYFVPDVDFKWEIDGGENIRRNLRDCLDDQEQYGINLDVLYFSRRYVLGSAGFQFFFPGGNAGSRTDAYAYNLTGNDALESEHRYKIDYYHRFNFNLFLGGVYPMGRFEIHGGAELLLEYVLVRLKWQGSEPVGYDSDEAPQGSFLVAVQPGTWVTL